jgi:SAM-dependent methyltransferase
MIANNLKLILDYPFTNYTTLHNLFKEYFSLINMVIVLFPGRHHLLTKFQHHYLKNIIENGIDGKKVDRIVFAVTSANHENTRRNPIPLYLRTMAITKFCQDLACEIKIYPIPDVKTTNKFAEYLLNNIFYQSGDRLTPENTILACSTPSVIKMFRALGFQNISVELNDEKNEKYSSLRPYEVIALLVKSKKNWRHSCEWKEYASQASQDIYSEYDLGDLIIELFQDALLNDDADITDTRDYNVYAMQMDQNVKFKFEDVKPFIKEGKIVDAGCGTGALVKILAHEFPESDIIGIEATRKFYEYCKMQDYGDSFVFFYRKNVTDQNFKENTVNSFIYSSILHEIYSYLGEKTLHRLLKNTIRQLVPGGRIIIRDVVGPKNPNQMILLKLNCKDGKDSGEIKELSTYAKFLKFSKEFMPRKIKFKERIINHEKLIETRLGDAYEYISKMNYTDNWKSEMHEEFGFWNFEKWKKELEKIGFMIVSGSKEFKSEYIIEKMYRGKAEIFELKNNKLFLLEYPATNMIISGEKI